MFYDNLQRLCKERGVKITHVITALGCSQGNLSKWKNGGVPKAETIIKIANFFDVSTDELINDFESDNLSESQRNSMFYDNLQRLCNERGVKITHVVDALGFSQGNLSNWKSGRVPRYDSMKKIADFFNVPVDVLVRGVENSESANNFSFEDEQLISAFYEADDNIKAAIRQLLKLQ